MRTPIPLMLMLAACAGPTASRADWLDLSDGVWDLTLTCGHNYGTAACPAPAHALLTISGAGASAMNVSFNGENFAGDPTDYLSSFDIYTAENSALINTPFSELFISNFTSAVPPDGLWDHTWGYCGHTDSGCQILFDGDWVATGQGAVPEPPTLALSALSLTGLAVLGRRRGSGRPAWLGHSISCTQGDTP